MTIDTPESCTRAEQAVECPATPKALFEASGVRAVLGQLEAELVGLAPVKSRIREWRLDRALRALATLPADAPVDPVVLDDLRYGWGNTGWAVDTEFLQTLSRLVRATPGPMLECGSGLTTLLAGALGHARGLRVWSLEHDADWCERVRAVARRHGLDNVTICYAPLQEFDGFAWYDVSTHPIPPQFGLVVCDGPPDATPGGRYGLLPVMRDRLTAGCVLLLDDVHREHDRVTLGRWLKESRLFVETMGATFAICRFA